MHRSLEDWCLTGSHLIFVSLMFSAQWEWLGEGTSDMNPLYGWNVSAVCNTGIKYGLGPTRDILSCLFFHVKPELREFSLRVKELNIHMSYNTILVSFQKVYRLAFFPHSPRLRSIVLTWVIYLTVSAWLNALQIGGHYSTRKIRIHV